MASRASGSRTSDSQSHGLFRPMVLKWVNAGPFEGCHNVQEEQSHVPFAQLDQFKAVRSAQSYYRPSWLDPSWCLLETGVWRRWNCLMDICFWEEPKGSKTRKAAARLMVLDCFRLNWPCTEACGLPVENHSGKLRQHSSLSQPGMLPNFKKKIQGQPKSKKVENH